MLGDSHDRFERAMLEFALRWHPYGGGSNRLIFDEFGLNPRQYFARLARILDSDRSITSAATRQRIRTICHDRLPPTAGARGLMDFPPSVRVDAP